MSFNTAEMITRQILHDLIFEASKAAASNRDSFQPRIEIDEKLLLIESGTLELYHWLYDLFTILAANKPIYIDLSIKVGNYINTPNDADILLPNSQFVRVAINAEGEKAEPISKGTTSVSDDEVALKSLAARIFSAGGLLQVIPNHNQHFMCNIYIPAIPMSKLADELAPESSPDSKGSILLMDDDEGTRMVISNILQEIGYKIITAAHGNEALAKYRRATELGNSVDLVILELNVKHGLGGLATLDLITEVNPAVRAILTSEMVEDALSRILARPEVLDILIKPFTSNDLLLAVQNTALVQ